MSTKAEENSPSVRSVIVAADVAADVEDWDRAEEILLEALSMTRKRKGSQS